jgi:DNA mismatch repair protein MutS2
MISEKSTQTLELPKILEQLARHTTFSGGAQLALELHPTGDLQEAQTWQKETAEARTLFINKVNVTLGGARDVRDAALQATRGVLIEAQTMLDIRYTLRRATTIKRTL